MYAMLLSLSATVCKDSTHAGEQLACPETQAVTQVLSFFVRGLQIASQSELTSPPLRALGPIILTDCLQPLRSTSAMGSVWDEEAEHRRDVAPMDGALVCDLCGRNPEVSREDSVLLLCMCLCPCFSVCESCACVSLSIYIYIYLSIYLSNYPSI